MKAKEYADRYNSGPTDKTLVEIACEFDQETASLLKKRGIERNDGFLSVLREMDDKWKAFARRCGGNVNEDGYRIVMRQLHPETAAFAWPFQATPIITMNIFRVQVSQIFPNGA